MEELKQTGFVNFTFHYGLIKTDSKNYTRKETIIFTFHYGLIKTLNSEARNEIVKEIYIPLWSY